MNTATPIPEMNPALETNIGYHTWDLAAGKRQWAKNGEDGGTPQHAYPFRMRNGQAGYRLARSDEPYPRIDRQLRRWMVGP